MTQAANYGAPRAADGATSPAEYADRVDDSFDALLTAHAGAARPLYAVRGTIWIQDGNAFPWLFDATNDLQMIVADSAGAVALPGAATVAGSLTVNGSPFVVTTPTTPSSATATGAAGTIAWDTDFVYVCVATDTWKRAALATW